MATGIAALILATFSSVYDWPGAAVNLAGISAAFFGATSLLVWCTQKIIDYLATCHEEHREAQEAHRAAMRTEMTKAQKALEKRLAAWQRSLDEREALRITAAFTPTQKTRLHSVEGPHGMG
ncbi:hypothetical protein [Amycolatopsis acidiphila]|uniref:hypothetical protein n=1 Tax=Amycolatopsis acidiphila TaxID=715473 RepID=UPI00174A9CF2|nr:hypothetical protein [Amycolatopsis acidiphila]